MLSSRAEILCWEELRDRDGLTRAGGRLLEAAGQESRPLRAWAGYALALAASFDGDGALAVERAGEALSPADRVEAPVAWRTRGLLGRSLGSLGREEEARKHLDEAATMLRAMADGVEDPRRRSGFLRRADVSQILRSAGV
jgi:hypothetical protein